jgi:hypothetical protein
MASAASLKVRWCIEILQEVERDDAGCSALKSNHCADGTSRMKASDWAK